MKHIFKFICLDIMCILFGCADNSNNVDKEVKPIVQSIDSTQLLIKKEVYKKNQKQGEIVHNLYQGGAPRPGDQINEVPIPKSKINKKGYVVSNNDPATHPFDWARGEK